MKKSDKLKELVLYVLFGALTTLVNFVVFWLCNRLIGEKLYLANNIIAWVVAVFFAYVTNKLFVFESKSWNIKLVSKEVLEFIGARVFSLAIEEGGLWLLVEILKFDRFAFNIASFEINGKLIAKVVLAVVVVILNYFFSKFVIFKKKS